MPGVIALGDSFANGHGNMVNDVQSQSYAFWLAEAAGLSFLRYSVGGAASQRVVDEQLPRLASQRFDLAAISVGTNDLLTGVPVETFSSNLDQIITCAAAVAERLVVTNIPLIVGRLPGARDRRDEVRRFNEAIDDACAKHDGIVVDISNFAGAALLRPDRIHPNALGQIRIATLAANVLRGAGMDIREPFEFTLGRPGSRPTASHVLSYAARTPGVAIKQYAKRLLRR